MSDRPEKKPDPLDKIDDCERQCDESIPEHFDGPRFLINEMVSRFRKKD